MKRVRDYWPGDFWGDMKQTLAWLYARQNLAIGNWQGNACATPTTPKLWECGIVSRDNLAEFASEATENIVLDTPIGVTPDSTPGPDGFPINFSPEALPGGNIFLNTFLHTCALTLTGRCFSLLAAASTYRVDIFVRTDAWYYKGSASLVDAGLGRATWSCALSYSGNPALLLAVLYPTTVAQPAPGWYGANLPAGWKAHTNLGVGKKLSDYKASVWSKTDIEYLKEDDLPIIVQDSHHARVGSQKVMGSGAPTVHIYYHDPVSGWEMVFNSLQYLAAFRDLPRSLDVPTSDPDYAHPSSVATRSWIYDAALAVIAYAQAGNFTAARRIITQLDHFLDDPEYLGITVLDNFENESTSKWTVSGDPGAYMDTWHDPLRAPFGGGSQARCHAAAVDDAFTYIGPAVYGSGLPDDDDPLLQWQFRVPPSLSWLFEISLTTALDKVQKFQVTSDPVAGPSYNPGTKTITWALGPADDDDYHFHKFDLHDLCAELAGDTWTSTTGFQVVMKSVGILYLDNISLGIHQPDGALSFSYDVYNGLPDQYYIRTGAMAWVCYAYCLYMQMSVDYTPALYLQRLLNFILTLESTDADLRNGLYKGGYGRYEDPGYHYIPGAMTWVSTEHNLGVFFAFRRAAKLLPTAAIVLEKMGLITPVEAASLAATASTVRVKADNVQSKILANLYIAPGADPGHFAQGADSGGLDTAVALDAAGTWSAIFCFEVGDITKATECLKFVYQKLYLANKQILKSSDPATWNMAYEQLALFDGFKPYGTGYSSPPASVWQEGVWGMIVALLRCYDLAAVQAYFAGVETSLDAFLAKLCRGQCTVRSTTGNGSFLIFSLASKGLPYEFSVWPGIGATAWFWLAAMNPTLLLSLETHPETLPYLFIPQGQNQRVTETDGQSSIGEVGVETIDPGGVLKGLASQPDLVGKIARLKLGFPGQSLGDFVTLHTVQITGTGMTPDGRFTIESSDIQRRTDAVFWSNGGPDPWMKGQEAPLQPVGPAWTANAFPVSDKNPRYMQGNPLDLLLAAWQNEAGLGQDECLPRSAWKIYQPGDDSTLINPNPYLDVPGILHLRQQYFSGDWMEFKITKATEGKQWYEGQLLKVLGLYAIVHADGRLALKSMKSPESCQPVMALNERNILGIPGFSRLPVINVVSVRLGADDTAGEDPEVIFEEPESIGYYKQRFRHQVDAKGLRLARGGWLRARLVADRVFRRHAFGTPHYKAKCHLAAVQPEVGDFVWLNHPNVFDFQGGRIGLTNVVCEVIDKQPDYQEATISFELLDTRFMRFTRLYRLAPIAEGVPFWPAASDEQKAEYMFLSFAAGGGVYSDGTPGNTIF